MRRNTHRNYRPASNSGTGPLATNHLELQDLDLELELLKRKRQIIEHQQQMLTGGQGFGNQQRQYGFNQPQQNFQGSSTHANQKSKFSQYYNDSQASNNYGSMLGKRPNTDPEWQSNSTPKRFTGLVRGPKGKYGADYKNSSPWASNNKQNSLNNSPWAEPKPLMSSKISPPNVKNKKNFKRFYGNKVSKGSPSSPFVNKLVSYPIPQRKALVEESAHLVKKKVQSRPAEPLVLRADTAPTQKMAGRLELALGSIVKDVKTKYGGQKEYKLCFISNMHVRSMKQSIRERIRNVMLNKAVGTVVEIVDEYRKVFPPETDIEILNVVKEFQKANNEKRIAINLEYSDCAVQYFKDNMTKLVTITLEEMFEKLEESYPCSKELDNSKAMFEELINEGTLLLETENETQKCEDDKETAPLEISEQNNAGCNDQENEENQEENEKNDEKQTDNEKLENQESVNNETEKSTSQSELEESKPANTDTDKKDEKKSESEIEEQFNKIDGAICALLKARLPVILGKHKNGILKILNLSHLFRSTKEVIMSKVKDMLATECRVEVSKQKPATEKKKNDSNSANNSKNNIDTSTQLTSSLTPESLPYFVKIIGRPYLPKRKVMQNFLKQFSPKSVKKHKNLHLLFVGFDDKKNYDDIVAIKKTDVGNMTILISPNEPRKKNNVSSANNIVEKTAESSSDKDESQVMDSNLNDQIDDLLISIRKQEEALNVTASQSSDNTEAEVNSEVVVDKDKDESIQDKDNSELTDTADVQVNDNKEFADTTGMEANNDQTNDENIENTDVEKNDENVISDAADTNPNDKEEEIKDKLEPLKSDTKESGRATPTRSSSRLSNATPSTIRTRRASRLVQN